MINRDSYVQEIIPFINKPFIKVLTGMRRCGKSCILLLLLEELKKRGIAQDRLLYLNFDNLENLEFRTAGDLHRYIKAKMTDPGPYYILLDEIQEVSQWEQAVNSLMLDERADIYITGSNSHLLSSELATYIAGRYIEFKIKPLSFREFRNFRSAYGKAGEVSTELDDYIRLGGFPAVHTGTYSDEESYRIISDIYASAVLRDIVQRQKIRNVELLDRIVRFVFDNTGNAFSAQSVADYFKSQYRKPDLETVYNYLKALEAAFIIKRIPRYDVKGKEILKTQEKNYAGDHALIFAMTGYRDRMIAGVLENIVLNELECRSYRVFTGRLGPPDAAEIDFIGERRGEKIYIQVVFRLGERETIEREFTPLLKVQDQYPKYVVSMDNFFKENYEGVRYMPLGDFLLSEDW
jgi:predicted AAA+ superfamily ATPase